MRESLTSYLFPFSHQPTHTNHPVPLQSIGNIGPLTPPSSFSSTTQLPSSPRPIPPLTTHSLPLTPASSTDSNDLRSSSTPPDTFGAHAESEVSIPLISSLFPFHATQLVRHATVLEIVTPPDHVLTGFICDHPAGRTVYVHLPPPHVSSHRPETLSGNFSEVLRPHDPTRSPQHPSSSPLDGLDIRESLTALLDLASEPLGAKSLVLALDKNDREREGLDELLHSLLYVGGQLLAPGSGALDGGWEWDPRKWVLVGVEL